jgi:lysophospholipase L1-like esterase
LKSILGIFLSLVLIVPAGCERDVYKPDGTSGASSRDGKEYSVVEIVEEVGYADAGDLSKSVDNLQQPETGAEIVLTEDLLQEAESTDVPADGQAGGGYDCVAPEVLLPEVIGGQIYLDGDLSSDTYYAQGLFPKYDDPMVGVQVRLLGADSSALTTTCANGEFFFPGLTPGAYLVNVRFDGPKTCTSANWPQRFPEAASNGAATIVTIGDSIATVGKSPRFPARLAWMFRRIAKIDNRNVAVPGSKASSWLPGGSLFEGKLAPELMDADVVIITIGGNDVLGFFGSAFGNTGKILEKLDSLDGFIETLHGNITAIATEIHTRAPHVDIVYCLYVNYAKTNYWSSKAGPYKNLFIAAGHNALLKAREKLGDIPYLLIADIFGAVGDADPDDFLSDTVHLNPVGHKLYAEQLFLTLGGANVSAESLGLYRQYGFAE